MDERGRQEGVVAGIDLHRSRCIGTPPISMRFNHAYISIPFLFLFLSLYVSVFLFHFFSFYYSHFPFLVIFILVFKLIILLFLSDHFQLHGFSSLHICSVSSFGSLTFVRFLLMFHLLFVKISH